jgi:hypothetical protein
MLFTTTTPAAFPLLTVRSQQPVDETSTMDGNDAPEESLAGGNL